MKKNERQLKAINRNWVDLKLHFFFVKAKWLILNWWKGESENEMKKRNHYVQIIEINCVNKIQFNSKRINYLKLIDKKLIDELGFVEKKKILMWCDACIAFGMHDSKKKTKNK